MATDDQIIAKLRRYGLPLKNFSKGPTMRHWQQKVWDEFTADERRNTTGYGVNCGRAGLVVIDLDTKATGTNGFDSWAKLAEGNENPATLTVSTPNGGEHRYYRITEAQRERYANIRNSVEKVLGTGIDVRAKGGQVVGPGSTVWLDKDDRSKGKGEYTIKHAAPIADLPEWLFRKLTAKPEPKATAAPAHSREELPYDFPSRKAKHILDKGALKVMNAASGTRNDTLYRQTYAAAVAGAPAHAVTETMTRAGIACGLPADEIERTVPRAVEDGAANYIPEYEPVAATSGTRTATKTAHGEGEGFAKDYFTEDNLAPLFADKLRSTAVYVTEWRAWAVYEPTTGAWRKESGETVSQWAKSYLKAVYDDAVERGNAADEVAARRLRSVAVRKNIMSSAAEELAVSSVVFDSNPDVMLDANGVIDLRTGELRDARPEDYLMRRTGVRYLPEAAHEGWSTILEAISADTREYVQTIMGQAFTGHQPTDASIYFFHGDGSNGKSSIIDTIRACAGDYAANPAANVLLRSAGANDHSLMVFKGLRLALFEELPDSKHLDAYIVKRLSGSQVLRAAHKYQAEEEFRVIATSLINTNHLPSVSEMEHGTWRRLKVIPMPYKFVKSAALIAGENHRVGDPRVAQWTTDNAVQEAALAWVVRGAVDWYRRGQQEPPMTTSMVKARDDWRGSNDKIGQWWQESIMDDPESFITLNDLYTSYAARMRRSGQGVDSKRSFLAMLEQHEVYAQSGAERVRGRHKAYTRSTPAQAEDDEFYRPRSTALTAVATFVRGVRFRTLEDQRDAQMSTDDRKAAILRSVQAQLLAGGLTLDDLTATSNEEKTDALDANDLVF